MAHLLWKFQFLVDRTLTFDFPEIKNSRTQIFEFSILKKIFSQKEKKSLENKRLFNLFYIKLISH